MNGVLTEVEVHATPPTDRHPESLRKLHMHQTLIPGRRVDGSGQKHSWDATYPIVDIGFQWIPFYKVGLQDLLVNKCI